MALYRIAWRELNSGATGHGEYILTMEIAQEWIAKLTKEHPEMKHWIESNENAKNLPT
jgi:hypothetical protein